MDSSNIPFLASHVRRYLLSILLMQVTYTTVEDILRWIYKMEDMLKTKTSVSVDADTILPELQQAKVINFCYCIMMYQLL